MEWRSSSYWEPGAATARSRFRVNRDKEAGLVETINYNIQKVPTFIIYRKGREIGRIIETPYTTLEKDLLMFFSDN
ncbi:MAG: thioredoxin family protein [Bacteroidales bacterium]|nr:thioredoxin family protein [Bacteroidales bacterium]